MARRTRRLWSDDEKRSICLQGTARDVSVAQVARRYALNANLIFKWLRDLRFAAGSAAAAGPAPGFLPVEIVDPVRPTAASHPVIDGQIEIELAGGHRLRVAGCYDPEALARLIRGLSG